MFAHDNQGRYFKIQGDGNCLYRALAKGLGGGITHEFLRRQLVDYVKINWGDYQQYVESRDAETYHRERSSLAVWGGTAEIMACAALNKRRRIVVVDADLDLPVLDQGPRDDAQPIVLRYSGRSHYDLYDSNARIPTGCPTVVSTAAAGTSAVAAPVAAASVAAASKVVASVKVAPTLVIPKVVAPVIAVPTIAAPVTAAAVATASVAAAPVAAVPATRKRPLQSRNVTLSQKLRRVESTSDRLKKWKALPETDLTKPEWSIRNERTTDFYQNAWEFADRDFQDIRVHALPKEKWVCQHCGAKFWLTELRKRSKSTDLCCGLGKRVLADNSLFKKPTDCAILSLYYCKTRSEARQSNFRRFIKAYNSIFATAHRRGSFGGLGLPEHRLAPEPAVIDRQVRFMASTHVAGAHNLNEAYLYFMDVSEDVLKARTNFSTISDHLELTIVKRLENYLRRENVLIRIFKNAGDIYEEEKLKAAAESREVREVVLCVNPRDKEDGNANRFKGQRRVSAAVRSGMQYPTNETVAGVYIGDRPPCYYDVEFVVRPLQEDASLPYREVNVLRSTLDLMLYPLIHLHGEQTFQNSDRDQVNSLREYYCFRLLSDSASLNSVRYWNVLEHVGKLRLQYFIDAGVKIEYNNVNWAVGNQRHMRAETYANLRDYLLKEAAKRGGGVLSSEISVGKIVVLPPSIPGSRRYYFNGYMDSMAICRHLGRAPTYLCTFTANRQWPEITAELHRLGKGTDDLVNFPEILCRVFEQKLDSLMRDLLERQILGKVEAYVVRIEFQKRGAPHAHILLYMTEADVPESTEDLDRIIWARWPVQSDGAGYERIRELVLKFMVHNKCNMKESELSESDQVRQDPDDCDGDSEANDDADDAPQALRPSTQYARQSNRPGCWTRKNECRWKFPKKLGDESKLSHQRTVYYRRPYGTEIYHRGQDRVVDNGWIIPYNPTLLARYNCHINIELCVGNSIQICRYINAYVNKGLDSVNLRSAEVSIDESTNTVSWDEAAAYVKMRFIGPHEAIYRILGLSCFHISHTVTTLPVHLQNEQYEIFYEGQEKQIVERQGNSKLIGWFNLNSVSKDSDKKALYTDVVATHTWVKGEWVAKTRRTNAIARLAVVYPSRGSAERFHLRMILCNVPGLTSFREARTVRNKEYPTFQAACVALKLVEDDDTEVDSVMQSVNTRMSSEHLRDAFALMLVHASLKEPRKTFRQWAGNMASHIKKVPDDIVVTARNIVNPVERARFLRCEKFCVLFEEIETYMKECSSKLCHAQITKEWIREFKFEVDEYSSNDDIDVLIDSDVDEVSDDENVTVDRDDASGDRGDKIRLRDLNDEQKLFANDVIDSVVNDRCQAFVLMGSGGTGKTVLLNAILEEMDILKYDYLATAFTGIAATLLKNGATAHTTFGLPLRLSKEPESSAFTSNLAAQTEEAAKIASAKLVVIDEVFMLSKPLLDLIELTCRQLGQYAYKRFGGKTVILSGDAKQLLPVVKGSYGRIASTMESIVASLIWKNLRKVTLKQNMRLGGAEIAWSNWVGQLGAGQIQGQAKYMSTMAILDSELLVKTSEQLIDFVFGDVFKAIGEASGDVDKIQSLAAGLANRAILCPLNANVKAMNAEIFEKFPDPANTERTYLAANRFIEDNDTSSTSNPLQQEITPDVLEALEITSLPPHALTLKVGSVVMLIVNLNVRRGLCNGQRMVVRELHDNVIICSMATGQSSGTKVAITRKIFVEGENDTQLAGMFRRKQFPLRLAHAITINKAQGQTLDRVGLYLPVPCFSHGQLYVAVSRVRKRDDIKVHVVDGPKQGRLFKDGRKNNPIYTRNIVHVEFVESLASEINDDDVV